MTTLARAGCIIFGRYNLADQRRIARLTVPIRATQQFSCDYGHFHFGVVTTLAGRVDRAGRPRGVGGAPASRGRLGVVAVSRLHPRNVASHDATMCK